MLEIKRGTAAAKNYENTFFREFAENIKKLFDKYSFDGLLIANFECEIKERLQIDALLVTNNAVCIINFKNFGGKIKLPNNKSDFEFGKWTNDNGEIIKGGNCINPFIQLKNQKERFINVCNKSIIPNLPNGDKFNPYHTVRIVCFQKPIELYGSIPPNAELNFFIIDKKNYLEKIKDIIDITNKEVKLSTKSFDLFKEIFRADKFDIRESYNEEITFDSYSTELNYENLYPDQKLALKEITKFIRSDNEKVFILQGSSLSGKSYLIPFIEDIAYNNGISQVKLFALTSRIATNLLYENNLEFNSLYSYIYGGGLKETQNDDASVNIEDEDNSDIRKLEIIPLKKSDNEDNALFIVDEAQLVSDNYHQFLDLRFGSGKLLKDFITFADLKNSNRKIIFIGDSFQLTIGKKEESTLNPDYLKEKYKLETKAFQLIDKEDKSFIIKQALIAVNGIRTQSFNKLSFKFSDSLKSLNKAEILPILKNRIENNSDFHLLTYSNAEAQKINYWIKKTIIKNGDDIAQKDLIIFNNNFRVEDANAPFAEPKKVFNGQFGYVTEVDSETITESITPKGKQPVTLKYRKISLTLKDTGYKVNVLSLENYRLSEKGELSEDEIIAIKIILNREMNNELNKNFEKSETFYQLQQSKEYKELAEEIKSLQERLDNGEKVKTRLQEAERKQRKLINSAKKEYSELIEKQLNNDTSSKYYKYKNAALIRFGWALTVHRSMSYKWDEIFFHVDQGENRGKTNEDYFRWIYTGLTRAKVKANLINYQEINPFIKIELKDKNSNKQPDKKIYFIANSEYNISEEELSIIKKYNFPEDKPQLLQLFQLIKSKLEPNKININSIKHPNYQELYELSGSNGEIANVLFYYNKKGQIKIPALINSEPEEFGDEIIKLLLENNNINDFTFIKDKWREETYIALNNKLNKNRLSINYIIQSRFKDMLTITRDNLELNVEMYYDGDGFYSSIIATYYNSDYVWNSFKEILNNLKG